MTTALSVLEERLSTSIGDYLEVIVTTGINADNLIASTHLTSYDGGRDDYFIDWWVYITDKANITVLRQVSDYATSGGVLTVRGAVLADDGANLATIRLHRYNRDMYVNALNDAIRELYPTLHRKLDVTELVTGNILPNSHFRDWASNSYPDKYTVTNATAAATTTAGLTRGGAKSALVTASAADGYMSITSKDYPRLLDLVGKSVHFYAWAYPSTANDAFLTIYTVGKTSTGTVTQTLNSTTACPATSWTLLKLEDQAINEDIDEIQFRFRIHTNGETCYFDHARVQGRNIFEYLMPTDFKGGSIDQVHVQANSYSAEITDDIKPTMWDRVTGYGIIDDGTDKFLGLPTGYSERRLIRLIGHAPLEAVSAYSGTISLDGEKVNLLVAYAKYKLYQMIEGPVSSQDVGRFEKESAKAYGEYMRLLPGLRMYTPTGKLKLPVY